ncbi:ZIP family metal transporter [Conexibacter sp. SYSU D00693]|uniref:ZIP family metal transporter n=1 Tax=Conexibacter sp. SYSU D00693 TaxID=2812560 RepID=UPI00196B2606|nr:hypothetical protein [Conexibacter sp. SYSU D00693]
MLEALLYGLLAGSSLLIGAGLGLTVLPEGRVTGLLLGFGAGAMISAVAFELAEEALDAAGTAPLMGGLVGGAAVYFGASRAMGRRFGGGRGEGGGGAAVGALLALGALLDGIPESAALGLGLAQGGGVGVALLGAVFVSNLPEAVGSAAALRAQGTRPAHVLGLWLAVALAGAVASAVGYAVLGDASDELVAVTQGFAAGAILTMLADTMVPESHERGGDAVGLATVAGFAAALLLAQAG